MPAPQRALEDFYTLRTICELAALDLPTCLDLPAELQDIYVARNMGLDALPDPVFGHQLADAAESHLAALVDGHDLDGLAAALHEAITGQ